MRLTEALSYYNADPPLTRNWMKQHFSHFEPTVEDERARKKYQARLKKAKQPGRKVMRDLFG